MEEGLKFYRCNTCGNMFLVMVDPNVIPSCCGSMMHVLSSRHSSSEKSESHLPIIEFGPTYATVKVGMQLHPMDSQHRIEWIALTDGTRVEVQRLNLTTPPIAKFDMVGTDCKLRAYAFCNNHGLWSSEK